MYLDGYLDIEEPENLLKQYQHSSAFVTFEMSKRKNMDVFLRLGVIEEEAQSLLSTEARGN